MSDKPEIITNRAQDDPMTPQDWLRALRLYMDTRDGTSSFPSEMTITRFLTPEEAIRRYPEMAEQIRAAKYEITE